MTLAQKPPWLSAAGALYSQTQVQPSEELPGWNTTCGEATSTGRRLGKAIEDIQAATRPRRPTVAAADVIQKTAKNFDTGKIQQIVFTTRCHVPQFHEYCARTKLKPCGTKPQPGRRHSQHFSAPLTRGSRFLQKRYNVSKRRCGRL